MQTERRESFSINFVAILNNKNIIFFGNIVQCQNQSSRKHAYIIWTPIKPYIYIVKLGFTEVYIFFLFLLKNIDCWYSLEPPRRGGSNEYPQSMFWAEIWKNISFFIWKFSEFGSEIFYIYE